jgi:hypothetical protein
MVLAALVVWALIDERESVVFFGIVLLMTVGQAVTLLPVAARGTSQAGGMALRSLRLVVVSWCVISIVVVGVVTLTSYRNHGFLGLARDTYLELETTGRFGVTVMDLAFVGLFVLMQLVTVAILIAMRRR